VSRLSLVLVAAVIAALGGCGGGDDESTSASGLTDAQRAVPEAMTAYVEARNAGTDLSDGPCIAEQLPGLDDWVADVAHDPREDVDDDPANQCERYRNGEASHFVELTPQGRLIRAE
jgi:hypothetical protein